MSTEENTKNPHLILEEIAKRLNRISGGVKVYPLHDAIRLAKEDTTKFLECLLYVKNAVSKIGQPTASSHQTVISIGEFIDEFSGSLSVEEIEYFNTTKLVANEETSLEEPIFTEKTLENGKVEYKHIVTADDLKNNPELVGEVEVGDEILIGGTSVIIDQDFLDEHPELGTEGLNIGDEIIWEEDDFNEDDFNEDDNDEESLDVEEDDFSELRKIAKDSLEDENKLDTSEEKSKIADLDEKIETIVDDIKPEEKLDVKASKTFDGKKTKVTKKLLSQYKILAGIAVVGDFIYIDDNKFYAFVVSDEAVAMAHEVNVGDVVIFDTPLDLA